MIRKSEQAPKERRSAHRTQWAAQFAVASELCKLGYEVALTVGNHPVIDLMVISPKGVPFSIDVKGQYKPNFWPVRSKEARKDLFYVFALVPDAAPNRFFILTQNQVNHGIEIDLEHARARRGEKGLLGEPRDFPGVEWEFAKQYEGNWSALPE